MAGFSPAFQFYPKEWLSSTAIAMMDADQERGYLRLLCHQWEDPSCSLPDDPVILAELSKLGTKWEQKGTLVQAQFEDVGEGRIANERLRSEFFKQKNYREARRKAGISSGKARRRNKAGTKREQNHEQNVNKNEPSGFRFPVSGLLDPPPSPLQAGGGGFEKDPKAPPADAPQKPPPHPVDALGLPDHSAWEIKNVLARIPSDRAPEIIEAIRSAIAGNRPSNPGAYALKIASRRASEIREFEESEKRRLAAPPADCLYDRDDFTDDEWADLEKQHKERGLHAPVARGKATP